MSLKLTEVPEAVGQVIAEAMFETPGAFSFERSTKNKPYLTTKALRLNTRGVNIPPAFKSWLAKQGVNAETCNLQLTLSLNVWPNGQKAAKAEREHGPVVDVEGLLAEAEDIPLE